MPAIALRLFDAALLDAVLTALPVVCVVAAVGVAIGIVQTLLQVQDQNVAFAPKLAVLALLVYVAGPFGLDVLRSLLQTAIQSMAAIGRA